jgi:hypothetical protein
VVECLLSLCEALGFDPQDNKEITKKTKQTNKPEASLQCVPRTR